MGLCRKVTTLKLGEALGSGPSLIHKLVSGIFVGYLEGTLHLVIMLRLFGKTSYACKRLLILSKKGPLAPLAPSKRPHLGITE